MDITSVLFLTRAILTLAIGIMGLGTIASPAGAGSSPVSCGGAAMLGGAQLMCSHVDRKAPAQFCTFSWSLKTTQQTSRIIDGSFLLLPGTTNRQVYSGSGFDSQMSQPIILCQGKRS